MKWTDEEIDKIVQDAAGKLEVPYQDEYWEEMEALLPVKSKKRVFWWMFSALFAFIGISSMLFMFSLKNGSVERKHQSDLKLKTNLELENKITSKEQTTTLASIEESQVDISKINLLPNVKDLQVIERSTEDMKTGDEKTIISVSKFEKSAQNTNTLKQKKNPKVRQESNATKNQLANDIPEIEEIEIVKNNVVKNQTESRIGEEETEIQIKEMLSVAENSIVSELVNDSLANLATLITEEKSSTAINENPMMDAKNIQEVTQQPATASSFYIQAGIRFSQSYLKTPSNQLMTGINLGVGYQKLKAGFGYSIGIHATNSFVKNMEINRKYRVYGFGVTNYEQNLKYKQLTYLNLPISLNYTVVKNTFSIGIAPTYLLSTMMNFKERQETEVLNERNYYGQKVGLKSIGLESMIGYQRTIRNNWSVGIQLGVTLIQQIEQNHFQESNVSMPLNGQITLRKTLILKR